MQEVTNAIQQALKEIHTRYDLKDSKSDIQIEGKDALVLTSADEFKLKAVNDVLQSKLVKRSVPLKALTYGNIEPAAGSTVRQRVTMQQGIPIEKARDIVKADQELQEESAGRDSGRFGSRQRQRSRYTAGNHRDAEAAGFRHRHAVHELPLQLTGRTVLKTVIRNAKEVFDLLHDDLAAIEREFGRDTVSGVRAITEIGEYLRAGGGKRLRPALLLLSCKLLNYPGQGAIKLGAVVEIIHTATLVHDDIIDEAQTRRGRPAANTQWGNSSACWPATGSTCRPSRSPCRSATSPFSTR